MSGRGVAALQTSHKKEPSGAPFTAGSARNGNSVDSTGRIVMGNDPGEAGDPAQWINDREILTNAHIISLVNGAAATDIHTEIANNNYFITDNAFQQNTSIVPALITLVDAIADMSRVQVGVSGGLNRQGAYGNVNGVLTFGDVGLATQIAQFFIATGNFRVGTGADNTTRLQVDGVISMQSATANLDFPNTAAQTSSDLTIAFAGAVDRDKVVLGVPIASLLPDSCYTAFVSAPGVITVRFNNYSAGAQNPPAGNFDVSIFKPL